MKDGFIKLAAACPDIRVGDVKYNLVSHIAEAKAYAEEGARIVAFPALSLTSASCGDMFCVSSLTDAAREALLDFAVATAAYDALFFVGLPVSVGKGLYSCTAAVKGGEVLMLVAMDAGEPFSRPQGDIVAVIGGIPVPVVRKGIFDAAEPSGLRIAVLSEVGEIGKGAGASVVVIPACEAEGIGVSERRLAAIKEEARRLGAAVLFANAGVGESGAESVCSGFSVIADALGSFVKREPFSADALSLCVDFEAANYVSRRCGERVEECCAPIVKFGMTEAELPYFSKTPFVPEDEEERRAACRRALEIQAQGLAGRFERSYSKSMVVGISGGLDSTLALLVMARAADILRSRGLNVDRSVISAITMPCFGTTKRTKSNAEKLAELMGASVRCIDIKAAVTRHFEDIGHSSDNYNVVYENAQARERTQVLMDIANAEGGLVVGTGDLSEAALGWATYNGDHMSMYGVNATVPKTLVRAIVANYADGCGDDKISEILKDILQTPVSPELLPPKDGEIAQCTEGIVGPYELHDFFIYHFVREGMSPRKLLRVATHAFSDTYSKETVEGWCKVFLRRFVTQQFKRSCTPDAPSVGIVSLSPRGAWRMPSDFSSALMNLDGEK